MTNSLLVNTCPVCNADGFEYAQDDVDIGIGVQTFTHGGWCRGACDDYVVLCHRCGMWGGKHADWCAEKEVTK